MKKILTKAISALIALATICSTSAFAGMVVDVPAETLISTGLPISTDEVETLNTEWAEKTAIDNIRPGWDLRDASNGVTATSTGTLTFGKANWYMYTADTYDLSQPFTFTISGTGYGNGFIVKIGDWKIADTNAEIPAGETGTYFYLKFGGNAGARVGYVKEGILTGKEVTGGTVSGKWWSARTVTWDGSAMSGTISTSTGKLDFAADAETLGAIPDLTASKVLIGAYQNGSYTIENMSITDITRPSSTKSIDNYYARLHKDDIVAEDITKAALAEAGWIASVDGTPETASDYKNWIKFSTASASIYSNNSFNGNYTIETKQKVNYNQVYTIFNYQDDNNYYALVNSQPSNYGNTKPLAIIKRYNGKNYYIWVGSYSMTYWQWNNIKINVSTDGTATTINMTSPVECTIVDKGGEITTYKAVDTGEVDADDKAIYAQTTETVDLGSAFTSGKIGVRGDSSGYLSLQRLLVYPTDKAEESTLANITVDVAVDGTAVTSDEIQRGVTTVSMPKKYLGINNKILVALYENHVMSGLKIYEASDFYLNDTLEAFDTTNASEDAEIGVFMWNSLGSIKPIISEKIYSIAE